MSLPLVGSAVGLGSWSSGVRDSAGTAAPGPAWRTGRKFMSADAWIRARVSLDGCARQADDDVAAGLRADFGFRDTGAVHTLADDRHGLVELLFVDVRTALNLGRQDHLGAAFKVQGKLGSPARLAGHGAAGQDGGQDGEDNAEPDQHPEGCVFGASSCHCRSFYCLRRNRRCGPQGALRRWPAAVASRDSSNRQTSCLSCLRR